MVKTIVGNYEVVRNILQVKYKGGNSCLVLKPSGDPKNRTQ